MSRRNENKDCSNLRAFVITGTVYKGRMMSRPQRSPQSPPPYGIHSLPTFRTFGGIIDKTLQAAHHPRCGSALSCCMAGLDWRPDRVYFLTLLEPLAGQPDSGPYRQVGQSLPP